ncbi:transcriptional repressor, partial [Neisseria sicca]|uniref:transcriptional repressor n=1 Tax=Neisseria sicca TaxID=490 RepID=UPI001649AE9B
MFPHPFLQHPLQIPVPTIYPLFTHFHHPPIFHRHHFQTPKPLYQFHKPHHHHHILSLKSAHLTQFHNPQIQLPDFIAFPQITIQLVFPLQHV